MTNFSTEWIEGDSKYSLLDLKKLRARKKENDLSKIKTKGYGHTLNLEGVVVSLDYEAMRNNEETQSVAVGYESEAIGYMNSEQAYQLSLTNKWIKSIDKQTSIKVIY